MDCNIDRRIAADARQGRETSEASVGFVAKTCGCRRCRLRRERVREVTRLLDGVTFPRLRELERLAVEEFLGFGDTRRPQEAE